MIKMNCNDKIKVFVFVLQQKVVQVDSSQKKDIISHNKNIHINNIYKDRERK